MMQFAVAVFFALSLGLAIFTQSYGYIFSKKFDGELMSAEKAADGIIVTGKNSTKVAFSMGIAVKTADGEIVTASTEDRQWVAVKPGICVRVVAYPYAPWHIGKGETLHDARLVKAYECRKKS